MRNVPPETGKVPALAAKLSSVHERTGQSHDRHDHQEPAEQHGEAERRVVPRRVGGEAGEGAAVVAGAGTEGVKNFAQAVRAVVVQAGQAPFADDAQAAKPRMETARISSDSIAIFTS